MATSGNGPVNDHRGLVIGLTGGIASGKSTVAAMFGELGAVVVSADAIAREVVEPGQPALEQIRSAFGPEVFLADGRLNRRRLGEIVFADPDRRRQLEAILHPLIRARMRERIEQAVRNGHTVVAEIPLLFESQASRAMVDVTVVVYADPQQQMARLMARDGLTKDQAEARLRAQLPLEEKARMADYVIDNRHDPARTREQVRRLWEELTRGEDYRPDRTRQEEG
ncbi:MAG: dephospho-CoA kinase [Firmicutes bacterium ZCTH02-B6]|nr:MAG: dephospho-CoA kinase [Firmicutes bacterium ZCTH02-B6]